MTDRGQRTKDEGNGEWRMRGRFAWLTTGVPFWSKIRKVRAKIHSYSCAKSLVVTGPTAKIRKIRTKIRSYFCAKTLVVIDPSAKIRKIRALFGCGRLNAGGSG